MTENIETGVGTQLTGLSPDDFVSGIVSEENYWIDGRHHPSRSAITRRRLKGILQMWGIA
jgi:hypothetical protein